MDNSNTRKGAKNIFWGFVSQIVTIALGIVIPRLFLVSYGSEMNGLLNSVSQVYTYMALLEAGVGAATLQALYKTVGQADHASINGVIAATAYYYRRIGIAYFLGVVGLSFVYPIVVTTTVPYWTVAGIIFLNGISGAIAFFVQGKYMQLIKADGRSYFLTNVNLISHIVVSASKIILILLGCNILVIQTVYMLINLAKMVLISVYVKRVYPWIELSVKPDFEAISQRSNALVHQVTDLIFRNTDVLVLTLVPSCGLLTVSVYTMYSMLFGMITTAVDTVGSGVEFIMGQAFNTDREKYVKLHDLYETYGMALIFTLFTTAYIFILPFMKLYTSGIEDISYIDRRLPLLFVMTFLMSGGRRASAIVINFAQHFKKTQNRAIFEAVLNLGSSLLLVFKYGIYGVLYGTIIGLLYRTNDMILYSNHKILNRSAWPTYKRWLSNFLLFALIAFASNRALYTIEFNSYLKVIVGAAVVMIVVGLAYYTMASALNRESFYELKQIIQSRIKTLHRQP